MERISMDSRCSGLDRGSDVSLPHHARIASGSASLSLSMNGRFGPHLSGLQQLRPTASACQHDTLKYKSATH
jgi:hypothetical protein